MTRASNRLRTIALAFGTAVGAYSMSPLLPKVAADDGGLGGGGPLFAFNFTVVLGIILAFIFGFGLRDYIHVRMMRSKSARKPGQGPSRL